MLISAITTIKAIFYYIAIDGMVMVKGKVVILPLPAPSIDAVRYTLFYKNNFIRTSRLKIAKN